MIKHFVNTEYQSIKLFCMCISLFFLDLVYSRDVIHLDSESIIFHNRLLNESDKEPRSLLIKTLYIIHYFI